MVNQLQHDFDISFWEKVGATREWAPDKILHLLPRTTDDVLQVLGEKQAKHIVVVATIQALNEIRSSDKYPLLVDRFAAVLFDEGHREPAEQWASAVRGLRCPTILFSATPFRNDLKLFDIDPKYVSFLSFDDAIKQHFIRGVEITEHSVVGAEDFARLAIRTRDRLVRIGRFSIADKMIVRASSAQHVDELFRAFSKVLGTRREGVLALHDSFAPQGNGGRHKCSSVPTDLRKRSETFLIHQYMLMEGIDDPSCSMLAVYDTFSTDRELVQQIGRLTRRPTNRKQKVQPAFVLSRTGDDVAAMWRRFLRFDGECSLDGLPPVRRDASVLNALISALPPVDYVSGKFRTRLDLMSDWTDDVRVPNSVVVFDVDKDFTLLSFEHAVAQTITNEDRHGVSTRKIDRSCNCHISMTLRQTPFLNESLFQSPTLEVTIYALHGRRLFFYDSAGLPIDDLPGVHRRLAANTLRSLMPDGETTFSAASMNNSDLGPTAIRSRRVTGVEVERSDAFLGEKMFVISQVAGKTNKQRRSIGFTRSRVREGEGYKATPQEFSKWTKSLASELQTGRTGAAFFERFATPIEVPDDTTPLNILIDAYVADDTILDDSGQVIEFDLETVCVDVIEDTTGTDGYHHRFKLSLKDRTTPVDVWIKWNGKRSRYWLKSDELSSFKLKSNSRLSLTQRLNRKQAFRIIPSTPKRIYAFGQFYSVGLDFSGSKGTASLVTDLFTGIPSLARLKSEKGPDTGNSKTWPLSSVFGLLERNLKPKSAGQLFGRPFTGLVCDDMGPEAADFIAYDEATSGSEARAVFVAAKWKAGKPGAGASNLYDICAQVTKNLAFLKIDADQLPGSPSKWDTPWTTNKKSGIRIKRIRTRTTRTEFKRMFGSIRRSPASRRQAWMVLGGGLLSTRAVKTAFSKAAPPAEALQLYFLLLSTYAACQSVGVDLKIFCSD